MGLARTPPQRAHDLAPAPLPPQGASPFAPRNPGVMRSPPARSPSQPPQHPQLYAQPEPDNEPQEEPGAQDEVLEEGNTTEEPAPHHSLIVDDRPIRPAPAIVVHEETMDGSAIAETEDSSLGHVQADEGGDVEMQEPDTEVDASAELSQPSGPSQPTTPPTSRPRRSHAPPQAESSSQNSQPAQPKTPRSRSSRRHTNPLPPPPPIQLDADVPPEHLLYGRRYRLSMEMLDRAVMAAAQRWTADQMRDCFPKLSKKMPKAVENTYLSASQAMRDNILANAHELLTHYKAGPAMQLIDEVDMEAREYAATCKANGESSNRPDAWRPDVSPHALVAATVLPVYDEAYIKLRDEYLELHKDCQERYASMLQKQALIKRLEENVGDGAVELDQTLQVLDNLPIEDMQTWTEATETKMDTRAPE
ncbi:hypothetical protein B9479_000018 [Cryptococcus floricola]|uniref:Uncharacterized protein n=1 Tax=Cryptococcus floricola TaxID=2591691 RepID=A0A5D3B8N0_9TREE|nr:hypothetical protein B9479_000018 [Cryptococcus floricola]